MSKPVDDLPASDWKLDWKFCSDVVWLVTLNVLTSSVDVDGLPQSYVLPSLTEANVRPAN